MAMINEFNFWSKLKCLFSSPNLFFEKVKSEEGIENSLIMYTTVGVFVAVLSLIFFFKMVSREPMGRDSEFYFIVPLYGLGRVTIGIIMTFLYSGLVHMIVLIFKGRGGYSDTYKAYTYSMVPFLLISSILAIGYLSLLYALTSFNPSKSTFLLISAIPATGYLSIIYSFILMIFGISKLHNISKKKSALVCLLPAFLIIGILIFFIIRLLHIKLF